jgi:hypothetical protein
MLESGFKGLQCLTANLEFSIAVSLIIYKISVWLLKACDFLDFRTVYLIISVAL